MDYSKVNINKRKNFMKFNRYFTTHPYDPHSIMHYGNWEGRDDDKNPNSGPTITVKVSF